MKSMIFVIIFVVAQALYRKYRPKKLEDLLGQEDQANLPGTIVDHPNWRRRLPVPAGLVLEEKSVARRIEAVAAERPRQ